ncbi:hypothetical protein TPHA_0E00890 [Tetrapisispora phaffii CBS 4417]|uniref:Kinesin motor domain-containing protein n=1 Tax=Tetrapisispora phaffii (strain ATCC 24235 / CBS 4417 / NBRC 1672 / NRRL Y-8282 / UCD 70-5) TaxID=1071381 RepID=G8BTF6_TETPH|nr:hypothetical protein TPHA_0E00890 [Tetrapisispora phaffii CBS 4417]CCE63184.1 hypothetical protein TPHA_0E00890 [Tetrapisispora phaffii CBS 4417]
MVDNNAQDADESILVSETDDASIAEQSTKASDGGVYVNDSSKSLSHTKDDNIKVYVRCRSRTQREIDEKSSVVISTLGANGNKVILSPNQSRKLYNTNANGSTRTKNNTNLNNNIKNATTNSNTGTNGRTYTFDKVFGVESDQETLFESVAKNYIYEMLQGYNCTVFAYGQTGTGKTYTMSGDLNILGNLDSKDKILLGEHAGIIPRVLVYLFKELSKNDTITNTKVNNNKNNNNNSNNKNEEQINLKNTEYSVKVSFLELYNEKLTDLLSNYKTDALNSNDKLINQTSGNSTPYSITNGLNVNDKFKIKNNNLHDFDGKNVRIMSNQNKSASNCNGSSITVKGMEEIYIKSAHEGLQLLTEGSLKRKVASTKLNDLSSRSHTIFTIITNVTKVDPVTGKHFVKTGKLNLVDLAGSENINRSGAENKRAQEAGLINKSLLTLGRVINALVDRSHHIPYRESKLTRLLQDSLGGKTKTCIIATVSPAKISLEETVSTLEYATRAKSIKNTPQINQSLSKDTFIHEYINEIDRLRNELKLARTKEGIYITQDQLDLYESNSILITEQKAKIDNMEDQIKRFKAKYVEETESNRILLNKLEQSEDANQKLSEKTKVIISLFKRYQENFKIFNSNINQIHSSNLEVFDSLQNHKDKLDLCSKKNIKTLKEIYIAEEKYTEQLNTLKASLSSYSDRFMLVFSSVFDEMENNSIEFERNVKSKLSSLDLTMVVEEIKNMKETVEMICNNILIASDTWDSSYKEVYNSHLMTLKNCFNMVEHKCANINQLMDENFSKFQNDIKSGVHNYKNVSSDHTNDMKHTIYEQSLEIEKLKEKIIIEQQNSKSVESRLNKVIDYFEDEILKSRRKITTDLIDTLKQSEKDHLELDKQILNRTLSGLRNFENEKQSDLQKSINALTSKFSDVFKNVSLVAEQLPLTIDLTSENLLTTIDEFLKTSPISTELIELVDLVRSYTEQSKSKPILDLLEQLNETRKLMLGDVSMHLKDQISSLTNFTREKKEKFTESNVMASNFIDQFIKYILTDYKDNMTQIPKSQNNVIVDNTNTIETIINSMNELKKESNINEYSDKSKDLVSTFKRNLPVLELPQDFKVFKDIAEEVQGTAHEDQFSPSRSHKLNSLKIIPSTPVPIPDYPLPKVLIPKSVNTSAQRSKTIQSPFKEANILRNITDISNPNNLKRRFTSDSLIHPTEPTDDKIKNCILPHNFIKNSHNVQNIAYII